MWMDEMIRQMDNSLKRCDVSGVDLLMNNHQSLKVEIDVRQENFTMCINLDESLEKYQAKATDAPTDTNAAIDTSASIDTNAPIHRNVPIDTNAPINTDSH
ncbi:unnamed protein product [Rotaria sordida]|uniref:Uncharacterized protein n=1 Tax=Rotaria sordida TaxID=392033 RepID=A0A815BUF3_9BILA|nr:unnamed protein product [Rotaria sordida]CAF1476066.1 unnamed protein product [Rotaria sordida]